MNLDYGRKLDLEDLHKEYKKASPNKKRDIERIMHGIKTQSKAETNTRETLIKAMRGGDHRAMKGLRHKLRAIKQKRTNNKVQL